MGLTLACKPGDGVFIGPDISVIVVKRNGGGGAVSLCVEAPRDLMVSRTAIGRNEHLRRHAGKATLVQRLLSVRDELLSGASDQRLRAVLLDLDACIADVARNAGERHVGDPCVKCGLPHDDVPPGPCSGLRA